MATTSINIVELDDTFARLAMTWVPRFYPGIQLELGDQQVTLMSEAYDQRQLANIWSAALLNEKLHAAAEQSRRATLEALLA